MNNNKTIKTSNEQQQNNKLKTIRKSICNDMPLIELNKFD